MNIIYTVYKSIYNFYVRRDGYRTTTHQIAGGLTGFFNLCILLILYAGYKKITGIGLPVREWRFLIAGAYIVANHFFLFNVLKFSKNGDMANGQFNISKETYKSGWKLFIIGGLAMLTVGIVGL